MTRLLGTSVSEALYIVHFLRQTLELEGEVCEFGVAQGATSALMASELLDTDKGLWLFDSFEGLPKPGEQDALINDIFNLGSMEEYKGTMCCPETEVKTRLAEVDFPTHRLNIVRGFIEDTIHSTSLPKKVCFAYVDLDLYEGTSAVLDYLDEHLCPGGYVIVDDYGFFSSGVKTAVDEFLSRHQESYQFLSPHRFAGHFCILRKNLLVKDNRVGDDNWRR